MVGLLFGLIGYIFTKLECEPAPPLLGFVLGPLMGENLRRAMPMSGGDATVFVTQPLSLVLLLLAAAVLVLIAAPALSKRRDETSQEET